MPDKSDDEKERHQKQSKDPKKKPKSTKSKKAKLSKLWDSNGHEVEMAYNSIKNRKSKKPLSPKEIRKHLDAISASVSELGALRRQKKNSSKVQPASGKGVRESMEPEGNVPEGTTNRGTKRATKLRNKRKRSDIKVKSEPESDSSESQRMPKKQSKRSTVSETEESTDSEESEE